MIRQDLHGTWGLHNPLIQEHAFNGTEEPGLIRSVSSRSSRKSCVTGPHFGARSYFSAVEQHLGMRASDWDAVRSELTTRVI